MQPRVAARPGTHATRPALCACVPAIGGNIVLLPSRLPSAGLLCVAPAGAEPALRTEAGVTGSSSLASDLPVAAFHQSPALHAHVASAALVLRKGAAENATRYIFEHQPQGYIGPAYRSDCDLSLGVHVAAQGVAPGAAIESADFRLVLDHGQRDQDHVAASRQPGNTGSERTALPHARNVNRRTDFGRRQHRAALDQHGDREAQETIQCHGTNSG
jgi:hypothetical protein